MPTNPISSHGQPPKVVNFHGVLLAHRCKMASSAGVDQDRWPDDPNWVKLYYGEQPRKSKQHLAKLAVKYPSQASIFAPFVEELLAGIARDDLKRLERKKAMQARREARAAKAAQRADLGVDLPRKGGEFATPATYKVMRVGLTPIENELAEWLTKTYTEEYEQLLSKITAAHWDASIAFPYRSRKNGEIVPNFFDPPPVFSSFFQIMSGVASPLPSVTPENTIRQRARLAADEAVAGFAAKLAGKVDTELKSKGEETNPGIVTSVTVAGNMWQDSTVTVATNFGTQVWHTQVIWNRSCLGKNFNQWPTRRSS